MFSDINRMKLIKKSRTIFSGFVCCLLLLDYDAAIAQPDHFAYAITATQKGGTEWIALRKLDTRTGEFGPVLFNVQDNDPHVLDIPAARSYVTQVNSTAANNNSSVLFPIAAVSKGVAAIAYDRKDNRLFYTAMNLDQLRYIDLNTMESFTVSDQWFSKAANFDLRNTGPINRMVIAPDDFGYTITNDGTHLIRFTTQGSPALTDLGDLVDDPKNKEMSIHSICANSGGDMIADDAGHLYLITGYNKVFKIDIASRQAIYLATISGLPQKFTTSGAAVSEDGKQLLLTSTLYSDAYFAIDPETWHATPALSTREVFETADLANSNALYTHSPNSNLFISKNPGYQNSFRVFPNPVMNDEVSVQFTALPAGHYTIQLADLFGTKVIEQKAVISVTGQTEILHISGSSAQGFYYVRILDEKNNLVGTEKLIVERW
jgi:Secretion system C-terminal sorting domain